MKPYSLIKTITLLVWLTSLLTACAGRQPNCLDADIFGHCNQWKGQPVTCTERFLGFCTQKGKGAE